MLFNRENALYMERMIKYIIETGKIFSAGGRGMFYISVRT